jgi:hypothetical protein
MEKLEIILFKSFFSIFTNITGTTISPNTQTNGSSALAFGEVFLELYV